MEFFESVCQKYSVTAGKLLATSPTLDGIKAVISKYLYSNNITLQQTSETEWSVSNAKGVVPDFVVRFRGNRYRFEET